MPLANKNQCGLFCCFSYSKQMNLGFTCLAYWQITPFAVKFRFDYKGLQSGMAAQHNIATYALLIPVTTRVGQNHIYIRCIYSIFCRKTTKYTVIYGIYIQFWPTLVTTHAWTITVLISSNHLSGTVLWCLHHRLLISHLSFVICHLSFPAHRRPAPALPLPHNTTWPTRRALHTEASSSCTTSASQYNLLHT